MADQQTPCQDSQLQPGRLRSLNLRMWTINLLQPFIPWIASAHGLVQAGACTASKTVSSAKNKYIQRKSVHHSRDVITADAKQFTVCSDSTQPPLANLYGSPLYCTLCNTCTPCREAPDDQVQALVTAAVPDPPPRCCACCRCLYTPQSVAQDYLPTPEQLLRLILVLPAHQRRSWS